MLSSDDEYVFDGFIPFSLGFQYLYISEGVIFFLFDVLTLHALRPSHNSSLYDARSLASKVCPISFHACFDHCRTYAGGSHAVKLRAETVWSFTD